VSPRAPERELTIEVTAEPIAWRISAAGGKASHPPPGLDDDLLVLRQALGFGVPAEGGEEFATAVMALERLAAGVGEVLTALLPQQARDALDRLAASAAVSGPALVRLRVDGADAEDTHRVLLLPWELLRSGGDFPLARGEIDLVREVVRGGLEEGFPDPPPQLTVVSHLAAPEGAGVPELNLEEAAFRMAQALDHLRERTRFTELGTLEDLVAAVAAVKPTLLHFAGHGLPGKLVFEDRACAPDEVAVDELLNRLRRAGGGRLPLAVWLSCCYGAGPVGELVEALEERLAGVSASREWQAHLVESPSLCADLHHAGIPQVLGYFGPVPDPLAVEVDRRLFEGLTDGGSGIDAVRQARLAIRDPIATPHGKVRYPLAWALLALYHRGPDLPLATPRRELPAAVEEALRPEVLKLEGVEVLRHGFIGRRRLLAELRRRRKQGERVLGLYGFGGLGKTATMTRLASILTEGGSGWEKRVLVVPAGQRLSPEAGEADDPFLWLWGRLEKALDDQGGLPEGWQEKVAEAEQTGDRSRRLARLLLSALGERILYVDNAETLQQEEEGRAGDRPMPWLGDDTAAFFATLCGEVGGRASVLITTRYRPADTPGSWVEIGPCSAGEIFRMTAWWPTLARLPPALRRHLAHGRLAGHPRAVQWVDELVREAEEARLERGGRRLEVTEDVETVRREVLAPALKGLPEKIEADLALAAVVDRLPPEVRATLGDCTAIGLPVPWGVVERLGQGGTVLRDRGLLTRFGVSEDAWAVHPFVRRTLERHAGGVLWSKEARSVLAEHWSQSGETTGLTAELEEALTHLVAAQRWEDAKNLLVRLSGFYRHRGLVRARLKLIQAYAETPWPDRERDVWLYHLGAAATAMGDYATAERALRSSVEVAERVYGTREHASVASSLHGLANVLTSQGRYADAEQAYRDSIDVQQRVYGTREHASVATSLHGLANVLTRQGRYADAEQAYHDSIDISERVYGTREHAEVAASLHGLANVLTRQGRYSDAEQAYRDSIDIEERVYGTRVVPTVLPSLTNLASMLSGQARDAEALPLLQEAWQSALTLRSAIDAVQIGVALVEVLLKMGDRGAAEERAREVRELLQAFPDEHPVRRSVELRLDALFG